MRWTVGEASSHEYRHTSQDPFTLVNTGGLNFLVKEQLLENTRVVC